MTAAIKRKGRPAKGSSPLRNFRLNNRADGFLVTEKERTGADMTQIMEYALQSLAILKPAARDALYAQIRGGKA